MYPTEAAIFAAFRPGPNWARIRVTAAIGLVVLNIFDAFLTQRLLTVGGVEANPLMAPIVGTWWVWPVKIGVPLLLAWRHLSRPVTRASSAGLVAAVVLYCSVVLWNAHLLGTVQ